MQFWDHFKLIKSPEQRLAWAVAIGADRKRDPQLVDACVAMFLPQMPDIGRSAGLVGPEVAVPAGAPAQDRLLGAMGRQL